jgi:hypothetical protein
MNFAGLTLSPELVLACISGIVWLIRLEGKMKQNEKDIERIEKNHNHTNEQILLVIKEVQNTTNELKINITTALSDIRHMNQKITKLEQAKVLPILQKYFDEEGNDK